MKVLEPKGVSVSDLLRETLVRVVTDGDVPFPIRTRTGVVSPETMKELTAMFLPELHQARWAEHLAQLGDEQRAATDPAEVQAIEARIQEHYKHRHDVAQTERALLNAEPDQQAKKPRTRG